MNHKISGETHANRLARRGHLAGNDAQESDNLPTGVLINKGGACAVNQGIGEEKFLEGIHKRWRDPSLTRTHVIPIQAQDFGDVTLDELSYGHAFLDLHTVGL